MILYFTGLRGCFDQFDKDGSGQLNCSELEEAMQLLGLNPSRQDVKEIMARYDVDGGRCSNQPIYTILF